MARKGLGRGLNALIKDGAVTEPPPSKTPAPKSDAPISRIRTNPWQPRRTFDQDALDELTSSVKERGVLQPLLVRAVENGRFELIAGERRLRAAKAAGLKRVPISVVEANDTQTLEIALVENLQREDLNLIEEAEGYKQLADEFDMTQEQISERVGKARASVANALRLLRLPDDVRVLVGDGRLSAGHAKLLAGLDIPTEQSLLAQQVLKQDLSVKALALLIQKARAVPRKPRASRADLPATYVSSLSSRLHEHFGTKVRVLPSKTYANGKKGRGLIEIDFYSNEDLTRIIDVLGISLDE